jgi:hypothetical protein
VFYRYQVILNAAFRLFRRQDHISGCEYALSLAEAKYLPITSFPTDLIAVIEQLSLVPKWLEEALRTVKEVKLRRLVLSSLCVSCQDEAFSIYSAKHTSLCKS